METPRYAIDNAFLHSEHALLLHWFLMQVLRTVTHDKASGHELAVNEFTTFILGTGGIVIHFYVVSGHIL
jgi:mannitol-specific phosphotransferase system IIBC component